MIHGVKLRHTAVLTIRALHFYLALLRLFLCRIIDAQLFYILYIVAKAKQKTWELGGAARKQSQS
jgi:hypothetical protein